MIATEDIRRDLVCIIKDSQIYHLRKESETSTNHSYQSKVNVLMASLQKVRFDEESKADDLSTFLQKINSHKFNKPWGKLRLDQKKECLSEYIMSHQKLNEDSREEIDQAVESILQKIKKNKKSIEIIYDGQVGRITDIKFSAEKGGK